MSLTIFFPRVPDLKMHIFPFDLATNIAYFYQKHFAYFLHKNVRFEVTIHISREADQLFSLEIPRKDWKVPFLTFRNIYNPIVNIHSLHPI